MALDIKNKGLFDAKESHWVNFRLFWATNASSFYFLKETSANLCMFQGKITLGSNQIRETVCQKQLQQPHLLWSLAYQLVQILHLLQAHLSQHQSQLLQSQQHKSTNNLSTSKFNQEPDRVLGAPQMAANGCVPC